MKKLALLTITALMINSVPAMEPMPAPDLGLPKPTHGKIRTATKNVLVQPVRIPPKIKLLRSNPHRLTAIRFGHVNPADAPDDEYILNTQARRPKVAPLAAWDDGEPISDYAQTRLTLARYFAVKRHRERRGQSD